MNSALRFIGQRKQLRGPRLTFVGVVLVLTFSLAALTLAAAQDFQNTAPIVGPVDGGVAAPYPSTITVSGLSGTITDVNVTLHSISHQNPDDLDILLVGPLGQKVMLVSDACGDPDLVNVAWTIDDEATATLPDTNPVPPETCGSGTYRPKDQDAETMPAPAPAGPYGTSLSVFDGAGPNGTWSLYVNDDRTDRPGGQIGGGWTLTIDTTGGGVVQPPVTGGGVTTPVVVQAKPGPDMIAIPEWATGGKVLQWTPVYYAPVQGAASNVELAPGTSIWVFGMDASGQFYQGMLSGKKFWLPVGVVGPNYEDPWYGRPLPTTVVEE